MELDSHADTCCAGSSFRLIEYTGQTCTVAPFTTTLSELKDIPIVKAATAYDDPITGETLVLVLAQALWFGDKLENSLICPNQLCNNGLKVEDTPRQYAPDSSHSIYFPGEDIRLSLFTEGYLSYIKTHTPTDEELGDCTWLMLTEDAPWDPYSEHFVHDEEQAVLSTDLFPTRPGLQRASSAPCTSQMLF